MSKKNKFIASAAITATLLTGGVAGAALGVPGVTLAQSGGSSTTATSTPTTGSQNQGIRPDRPRRDRFGDGAVMAAAAKTLGMSEKDLRAELRDGKSLAAIAEEKGVDRQTLVDAMVAAGEKQLDEAKAKLPERIGQMVDHVFDGSHMGDHGPRFPRIDKGLDVAAETLGMSEDDLKAELRDGKSLADIAEEKGVDRQTLVDAMVADAKAHIDAKVADGTITQEQADRRIKVLTKGIEHIVDGERPFPGRGPGRPGWERPGQGNGGTDNGTGGN